MSWQTGLLAISACINILLTSTLVRVDGRRRELKREVRHLRELLRRKEWEP